MKDVPSPRNPVRRMLFLCVANSARNQMAEGPAGQLHLAVADRGDRRKTRRD